MFPGVVEGSGALKALGTRAVGGSGTLGPAPPSWGSAVHSLKQSGCIPWALQGLSDLPRPTPGARGTAAVAPGTRPPPLSVPESRLPQPPASLGQGTSASPCGQGCGDQLALGLAKAATTSLDPMLDPSYPHTCPGCGSQGKHATPTALRRGLHGARSYPAAILEGDSLSPSCLPLSSRPHPASHRATPLAFPALRSQGAPSK